MYKKYIPFPATALIILIVAGFFVFLTQHKDPTINKIYDKKLSNYEVDLASYNTYLDAYDQYKSDLTTYNEAVEADANKEEVPEDGIIKVDIHYSISNELNGVGNEWTYVVKVNGNQITDLSDQVPQEININAHDPLTVYVKATENDDAVSDVGMAEEIIHYKNEDIIEGFTKTISVNVREDAGRYTGSIANITVSLDFKRVIEQIIIPDKPTKPEAVSAPVKPEKKDIKVNIADIIKYNKAIKVYAVTGMALIALSIINIAVLKKRK